MRSVVVWKLLALAGLSAIVACSADSGDNVFGAGTGKGGSAGAKTDGGGTAGSTISQGGAPGNGGGMIIDADISGEGAPPTGCNVSASDTSDNDKDGYSAADGDCNDCDALINPGAFDDGSPTVDGGAPVDTNCDGAPGGDTYECDDGLQIVDNDAFNAAKAIGLCKKADANATGKDKTWGVVDARFVKADGTPGMNPLSHGILPQFGAANVQAGKTMLGLSSGTARGPAMPGYKSPANADMGTDCDPPIPNMDTPACPDATTGEPHDAAALEVMIRVPTNSKSFKFNLNFYTYEFPGYICSTFNDFFVTLMNPKPAGSSDGNISFDQDGNPISVNNSMLQVCNPQSAGGKTFSCPLKTALLQGTGFEGHAATGWLQTISPVESGSTIKLRFAVWDSGDHILDSTVLVDNFAFSVEPASGTVTEPIENPK